MPTFFFHLENTSAPVLDTEGVQLDGLEAAKCHAVTVIAAALCESPKGFWETDTYQITVADADGLTLFMVCMMAVIAPVMALPPIER